mmetsp:Transcript_36357/g.86963  ORF Transcript_36357/g.86963 Transcript_36357/m.86963 type:complete len:204 (-) Transcript_36357:34-645(-)
MLSLFALNDCTGSMSVTSWTSTPSSFWPKAGVLSWGGNSERIEVWFSGLKLSGNWMVRMRKRLPWTNGFLYVGIPSSFTALIIRSCALAFGSASTYIVAPFFGCFAAKTSSREACLKKARPPRMTKQPTSMPLRLSWVSHAFLSVSTSAASACATKSTDSQSQSSNASHSIFPLSCASGSTPLAMGFTSSPGALFTSSFRPSR